MKAYDRIYQALLDKDKSAEWKKKVDKTIKKYRSKGKTATQAIKAAATELNTQQTNLKKVEGFFLKQFDNFDNKRVANVLLDGEAAQFFMDKDMPEYPCKLSVTDVEKTTYIITGKVEYRLTDKSKVKTSPVLPDDLISAAKEISDCSDGEYALLCGELIDVSCWDKEGVIVTPDKVNLKVNFRSGVRSGFFVRDLDVLPLLLPSQDDIDQFNQFVKDQDWAEMVNFLNEVSAENREIGVPGVEMLLYGRISDNTWTDRSGEERTGKNFNLGAGGFAYCVDLLYDLQEPDEEPEEEPEEEEEEEEEGEEQEEQEEIEADEPPIDAPEGESLENKIMELLKDGPHSPSELVSELGAKEMEIASQIDLLMKNGKISLKDGKFALK